MRSEQQPCSSSGKVFIRRSGWARFHWAIQSDSLLFPTLPLILVRGKIQYLSKQRQLCQDAIFVPTSPFWKVDVKCFTKGSPLATRGCSAPPRMVFIIHDYHTALHRSDGIFPPFNESWPDASTSPKTSQVLLASSGRWCLAKSRPNRPHMYLQSTSKSPGLKFRVQIHRWSSMDVLWRLVRPTGGVKTIFPVNFWRAARCISFFFFGSRTNDCHGKSENMHGAKISPWNFFRTSV